MDLGAFPPPPSHLQQGSWDVHRFEIQTRAWAATRIESGFDGQDRQHFDTPLLGSIDLPEGENEEICFYFGAFCQGMLGL